MMSKFALSDKIFDLKSEITKLKDERDFMRKELKIMLKYKRQWETLKHDEQERKELDLPNRVFEMETMEHE